MSGGLCSPLRLPVSEPEVLSREDASQRTPPCQLVAARLATREIRAFHVISQVPQEATVRHSALSGNSPIYGRY
jgi:hypothetical protein